MSEAKKRKQKQKNATELRILHPAAAGIDIGATEIYVAVRPDRDPEPVRSFSTFTEDLYRLADWWKACAVETVANGVHRRLLDSLVPDPGSTRV